MKLDECCIVLRNNKILNFIIILSLGLFVIDYLTNPCTKILNKYNLIQRWFIYIYWFTHHLLANLLYFGFLFEKKELLIGYLILILLTVIHWQTNNEKCILTEVLNIICEINRNEVFKDIFYWFGIKELKYGNMIIYIYVGSIIFITIKKLI